MWISRRFRAVLWLAACPDAQHDTTPPTNTY